VVIETFLPFSPDASRSSMKSPLSPLTG
jgi:hypothetical protein